MNTDALQNRRSFLRQFTGSLMVLGLAGTGAGNSVMAAAIRPPVSADVTIPAELCEDGTMNGWDEMSDPGWSY